MSVNARMQQENQHGEQGDEPIPEQPISQQPREESADEEEEMREQAAEQKCAARVFQPQKALGGD